MKNERNYGIDFARIIMMFLIVFGHSLTHTNIRNSDTFLSLSWNLAWLFQTITTCAVLVFVLITGYFYESQVNIKDKVIRLWIPVFFISGLCYVISLFCGHNFEVEDLVRVFLPVLSGEYWFFTIYFLLLIISPFLSKFLKLISEKEHRNLCIICVVVFFILPVFAAFLYNPDLTDGYSILNFISLYIVGAYIKRKKININKTLLIAFIIANGILIFSSKIVLELITNQFQLELGTGLFYHLNNVLQLLQACFLFLLFSNLSINNNYFQLFISKLGKSVFLVYLLHDNPFIRNILWGFVKKGFGFVNPILVCFISSLIVFVVCYVISFLLEPLFNFVSSKIIGIFKSKQQNEY